MLKQFIGTVHQQNIPGINYLVVPEKPTKILKTCLFKRKRCVRICQ